jgi:DNA-binding MltR family transcriptional regulator
MTEKKGHREHWENFFSAEIRNETDRASIILAAAMLEQALETLLRPSLVSIASQNDPLFDGAYAPISTFSAKIDLAYRMGLIPANFTRGLHLIRKVRNDFAHNVTGCTFDDASVRSRILELARSQGVIEAVPKIREQYIEGPAGDMQITVSWMLWWLWTQAENAMPLHAASEFRPKSSEKGET